MRSLAGAVAAVAFAYATDPGLRSRGKHLRRRCLRPCLHWHRHSRLKQQPAPPLPPLRRIQLEQLASCSGGCCNCAASEGLGRARAAEVPSAHLPCHVYSSWQAPACQQRGP